MGDGLKPLREELRAIELTMRWAELFDVLDVGDLRLSPLDCARRLGLHSGSEVERELRGRGLPRFRLLRDWFYVVRLHERAIAAGSLSAVAALRGDYPSVLYRFVQRVTGRDWRELSQLDSHAVWDLAVTVWSAQGARSIHPVASARRPERSRNERAM